MTKQQLKARLNAVLICLVAILLGVQVLTVANQRQANVTSNAEPDQYPENVLVATKQVGCTGTIRTNLLNQRSGPNESYPITGTAKYGEVVTVIASEETHQWLQVNTSDGSAWLSARYITLSGNCNSVPVNNPVSSPTVSNPGVRSVTATATPEGMAQTTPGSTGLGAVLTRLSTVFTQEVQYWASEIAVWAKAYQIDPNLIATVIQIESCGDPSIRSAAGAQGLFQVMPFHFAAGENMLDVETNARRGLSYLQGALKLSQGNVASALAGYNGGYGVIDGGWAVETQQYSYWGSRIYAEAISGLAVSPTLQAWLSAGGTSLCARASKSQQMLD